MCSKDPAFKTLRHMETVRNYIDKCIVELIRRGEQHDQSKLEEPEWESFKKNTPRLKSTKFGSPQYKAIMNSMRPAINHHNEYNRHHPEYHDRGIKDMTLIDLVEMLCDWKSASLRSKDGNAMKSIETLQQRFGYSDELRGILENTLRWIESNYTFHHGEQS